MDNFDNTTTESEPSEKLTDTVLIGTFAKKRTNHRKFPKPSDEIARHRITKIPKRLEALFILFADTRENTGLVLTREELDINPATKDLTPGEKDAMVRHWPQFKDNLEHARELRKMREEEAQRALVAHKNAARLAKANGLDGLSLPEQMRVTAKIYDQQIQHAALIVAGASIETLHTDKASLDMMKVRVQAIKDLAWIRDKISDLAERIEKEVVTQHLTLNAQSEAHHLLQQADALLIRRGAQ